jgi:hypothetical protein
METAADAGPPRDARKSRSAVFGAREPRSSDAIADAGRFGPASALRRKTPGVAPTERAKVRVKWL